MRPVIKIMGVAIIALVVGAGIYMFFLKDTFILPPLPSFDLSIFQRILDMWGALPDPIKMLIAGVPSTVLMLFFAWTKTRAMNQLEIQKQQSLQQLTQVQGEKAEIAEQLQLTTTKGIEDLIKQKDDAQLNLTEAQKIITSQKEQLQRVSGERNYSKDLYDNLLLEYNKLKQQTTPKQVP